LHDFSSLVNNLNLNLIRGASLYGFYHPEQRIKPNPRKDLSSRIITVWSLEESKIPIKSGDFLQARICERLGQPAGDSAQGIAAEVAADEQTNHQQ
jgi:hypothetical protein